MLSEPKKLALAISFTLSFNNSQAQFEAEFNLNDLNGTNGLVINGVNTNDLSGYSVSYVGDINGDGVDDVIIGAPVADPSDTNGAGSSYVVFGSDAGLPSSFNLSNLNGLNGFVINGVNAIDNSGSTVSHAGDVNGDGIDDLIIGASLADPSGITNAGSSYVVFGSDTGLPNPFNLSSLNGLNGFVINGVNANDNSGNSVSYAGDVNGDGIDDLIIGADNADPNENNGAGSSYVVFGSDTGLPNPLILSGINGLNGFVLNGVNVGDNSGSSVSYAGDVNGDGIDDLIIGASIADPSGITNAGSSYVVFGSDAGLPNPFNLSSLNGLNGLVLNGVNVGDSSGSSVSYAGDVNGDGIDDVIIGATNTDLNGNFSVGSSYVVFGSDTGLPNPLDLSNLNGLNGFVINGVDELDESGASVSHAGDVNGDGIDDLIIGAVNADPNGNNGAGSSYVVFGSDTGLPNPLNLSSLNGVNGFVINGVNADDQSGFSVSQAGDFNGDGIDDMIVGAPFTDSNGDANIGSSYVVFGQEKPIFADDFEQLD